MAKNIQIEPSEEYTKAQLFLKRYLLPIVIGVFIGIAATVVLLVSMFYPQDSNGTIEEPNVPAQQ